MRMKLRNMHREGSAYASRVIVADIVELVGHVTWVAVKDNGGYCKCTVSDRDYGGMYLVRTHYDFRSQAKAAQ